ncbi:DsbA family oxidoreductase [Aspergillus saccharolyticus JOP 1030-1]|uniref:DSBA-like thioredoxin domain-containing protein n=1 Tax=Aspergillus saccharolyticus JOP 1030-1 TaxID=1450539 RepID=A0A319A523_9EURO|nr:DSBA-like thioredoxin domain-containing protein [Aspergillus saccharolyticus JOP 1030-1]PYH42512.1 DSBA-like thioredoxin domain-containing protein [Aspergillus saccharolyticus JOP 1030-1]
MALIHISIASDPVCPWCYIGYRRLTQAIRLYRKTYPGGGQDTIRITWKPYILDPNASMESIPYIDRMTQKLGADKVAGAQAHVLRLGRPDGIHFRFGGRIGSTIRAHQVIMLSELHDSERFNGDAATAAAEAGAGTAALVEALFEAHFEREEDITDVDTLVRLAVQAGSGLDARSVRSWLEEGRGVEEITQEAQRARDGGIQGVPFFQFGDGDRQLTLSGGQEVAEFLQVLIAYKEGLDATTPPNMGTGGCTEISC